MLHQREPETAAYSTSGQHWFLHGAMLPCTIPWIVINDPTSITGNDTVSVPPSGHIARDLLLGVTINVGYTRHLRMSSSTGAVALERILNDADQGELNVAGIDVLRVFPGQRPIVWGTRTDCALRDATPWRYVNVRRLFIFIEKSLQEGLRWAVFEPNDFSLWKKLERTISEFLTRVWRSGALFGKKADEAFLCEDRRRNWNSTRFRRWDRLSSRSGSPLCGQPSL